MSYSPGIGLILNLGLDSSGVDAGLSDAEKSLGGIAQKTGEEFAGAGSKADKALLSNRESVRLLSEEFGIHLPRAVSSALAEMLPSINMLGPALMGAFAGEEILKFAEAARKAADAVNEVAKSEKLVKEIGEENVKAMETMAKKSVEYAHTQLALLNAQIVAGELNVEQLKRHEEGLDVVLPQNQMLLNAYHFWLGQSKDLKTAEAGLSAELKLRDALIKILGEDMAKTNKESAKSAEVTERNTLTEKRWREELIKGGQEAGKVAAAIAKYNDEVAASAARAAKAELQFALDLEKFGIVDQRNLNFLKQYTPAAKAAETETRKLAEARKWLAGITQDAAKIEDAFKQALKGDSSALDSMVESAGQTAEAIASMTESTKAVAYVEGAYDAAKSIECMAKFIGSYGTDGAQLAASIQWAAAAEQQFAVAGRGSHHGATGGSASREGGRTGPQAPGAMGSETPITPGVTSVGGGGGAPSGTLHVMVMGEAAAAQFLVKTINNGVNRYGMQVQTGTRPKAGR